MWDVMPGYFNQVTCFEYADQLLPREDPDAAKCLEGALLEDGLEIRLGELLLFLRQFAVGAVKKVMGEKS